MISDNNIFSRLLSGKYRNRGKDTYELSHDNMLDRIQHDLVKLLGPSVAIRSACRFWTLNAKNPAFILLLTDKHLHYLHYIRGEGLNISKTIPLNKINSVSKHITYCRLSEMAIGFDSDFHDAFGFWIDDKDKLIALNIESGIEGGIVIYSPFIEGKAIAESLSKMIGGTDGMLTGIVSVSDELKKISQLKNEGLINEQEWDQAKKYLIGAPPSKIEIAERQIRQLYALCAEGALTESEFRMKKWDILSKT